MQCLRLSNLLAGIHFLPNRPILMPTVEERLAVLETWREEHVRAQDRRDAREWKIASLLVAVAALVATVIGLLLR